MQRTLLLGGPVNPDAVFVLHSEPEKWSKSIKVNEDIGLTTSSEVLEAIAGDKGPGDYLIALGYSGWNQGQLEDELAENLYGENGLLNTMNENIKQRNMEGPPNIDEILKNISNENNDDTLKTINLGI